MYVLVAVDVNREAKKGCMCMCMYVCDNIVRWRRCVLFIDHCSTCYRCRWLIALLVMSIVDGEIVWYLIVLYLPTLFNHRT